MTDSATGFYEDDEDPEKIHALYDAAVRRGDVAVTRPPLPAGGVYVEPSNTWGASSTIYLQR